MRGTNGRPQTAQCRVGGTTPTEIHEYIRVPDGEAREEDRVPVEVAAAAAAAEVNKERLGKGKEEEEERK